MIVLVAYPAIFHNAIPFLVQVAATMSQKPLISALWHIARFIGLVAVVLTLIWRAPSDSEPMRLGQHDITMMRDGDQRVVGIEINKGDLYDELADDIAKQTSLTSFHAKDLDCTDELISALKSLPRLTAVRLDHCNVTAVQLQMLNQIPLKLLGLSDSKGPESGRLSLDAHNELTDLELSGCHWIRDEDLAPLAKLPKLESLSLTGTSISNSGLQKLAASSSLLRINLSACPQLNDETLKTLQVLTNLQQVTIHAVPLNLQAAADFQNNCPNTRLAYDQAIAPDLSPLITKYSLEAQNLSEEHRWPRMAETGLITSLELHLPEPADVTCLQYLEQLRSLRLTGAGVRDPMLPLVFASKTIKALNLSHSRCTDSAMAGLQSLNGLEELILNDVTLGTKTFQSLATLPNLKRLHLNDVTVQIDESIGIIRLENLNSLTLNNATRANHFVGRIEAPQLTGLSLVSCNLYDDDIALISRFSELRQLDLSENPVHGETLSHLSALPIQTLMMQNTALTDRGLSGFSNWKGLFSLYLTASPFNGSGFAECPNLSVYTLNLSQINLSEEGVNALCKIQVTNLLMLVGAELPSGSIQRLASLLPLQQLAIDGAHLSSEQLPTSVGSKSLKEISIRDATPEQLQYVNRFESIEGVTLVECRLTTEAAKTLAQSSRLKRLAIRDCALSNQAFQILTTSETLENILLQGRGIDQLDQEIVRQARPDLEIQFQGLGGL